MKSVLFIHRSVGQNLLQDGQLAQLVADLNSSIEFRDIDNNQQKGIPGDDTKPSDYAKYFNQNSFKEDLIIIKSCYPNNAIQDQETLERLKETYKEIAGNFLKNSKGSLLIMTTPPLRPFRTNAADAQRARELATWLVKTKLGSRVSVFDFYDLLAERGDSKNANMLKKEYRRFVPWDNHPSKAASRNIAPILAKRIAEV